MLAEAKPRAADRPQAPAGLKHRNLPLLLLQAREGVISHFRPLLNAQGVTEQQWRIVRALLEHGPMEPRQIGELCRLSSPSLAGMLARMDEQGLVQRERMAADLRRVSVSVTPKSRRLAAAMAPHIEAAYARIEEKLGREFFESFTASLDHVIATLGGTQALADEE